MTITVAIPVGPDPMYREYLPEALASIRAQTLPPDEVLIIDDQAHLSFDDLRIAVEPDEHRRGGSDKLGPSHHGVGDLIIYEPVGWNYPLKIWRTPWLSGVAHSFNFGVAKASNDLVFMMGSDDKLMPHCLEDCLQAYAKAGHRPGYYWVDVQYNDGEQQRLACNAAMVHREMWRSSGGFPVEASVGPCDTMLVSILMVHPEAGAMFHVESETPPYWYRRHEYTYSRVRGSKFGGVHSPILNKVTELWRRPTWT